MFSPAPGSIYLQRLWVEDRLADLYVLIVQHYVLNDVPTGHYAVLITLPDGSIRYIDRYGFRFPSGISWDDWKIV